MDNNKQQNSRRRFLQYAGSLSLGTKLTSLGLLSGLNACATAQFGSKQSYLTQVIKPQNNNVVFHWLDIAMQQTRDQRTAPPRAAYNFALPLVAGFLAANAITQQYQEPYGIGIASNIANPEIAYGVAFALAAAEVFQQPFVIERHRFLSQYENSESKERAIQIGRRVARQIIKQRNNDGSEPSEANFYLERYTRREDSLRWRPTGPFYGAKPGPAFTSFARGLFPGHGQITPWTIDSVSQLRAPDFHHPDSPEFAREFNMIKQLGGAQSTLRNADQSEIALFWENGPWGITPPGHFLYIAAQVLQERQLSFMQLAHSFALLGMTQCDASITAWNNKYHHDIIRPESAIRLRAKQFDNADQKVTAQNNWRSYIPTPEFPSYTSGHSTFGAAGTHLIALIYGSDKVSFSGQSPDQVLWPQLSGATRHWTSLSQAAEENGMSRLYGGVHWEVDHLIASKAGKQIAEHAFNNMFLKKI